MAKDFKEFLETTLSTEFVKEWDEEQKEINEIIKSARSISEYSNAINYCELYTNRRIVFMLQHYHEWLASYR